MCERLCVVYPYAEPNAHLNPESLFAIFINAVEKIQFCWKRSYISFRCQYIKLWRWDLLIFADYRLTSKYKFASILFVIHT